MYSDPVKRTCIIYFKRDRLTHTNEEINFNPSCSGHTLLHIAVYYNRPTLGSHNTLTGIGASHTYGLHMRNIYVCMYVHVLWTVYDTKCLLFSMVGNTPTG